MSPSYLWIGDTVTLYAEAGTKPEEVCYRKLYDSYTAPLSFSYQSSDSGVASISKDASLRALSSGVTQLRAATAGITTPPLTVIVGAAIGALRMTVSPAAPHVGDTITVRTDALSALGDTLTDAQVEPFNVSDSLVSEIPAVAPVFPYTTLSTPMVSRFVARRAGSVTIVVSAPHATGHPLRYVADTVIIRIGN